MGTKGTDNTITFTLGEETLPKIEGSENYAESLFKEQYDKSFDWVASYLEKVDKAAGDKEKLRDLNNVLAYIGERGSGKTSCMLSVAKILGEGAEMWKDHNIPISFKDKKFKVLDCIDPSFFDTKNNILSLIIARLFGEFNEEAKNRPNDERERKERDYKEQKPKLKHELLDIFKKVNDNIDLLLDKKKEFSEDSLQRIDDLAVASNLRDNIEELIKNYLKFLDNKDVLVIPVDDVDLHTSEAYKMVEQIRKYFMLPNVIVLFAVKLDQLALVVKKQYANEFKELLNKEGGAFDIGVVDEMVDRYLGKFIPLGQRIYLADAEVLFERKLEIRNEDGTVVRTFDSVREAVPTLIFQKTRYLFYNSSVSTSPIVPRNLRELRMLIYMLWKMGNYWDDGGKADSMGAYNKTLFKKYFFESWTAGNLESGDQKIIKNLLAITDAATLNMAVVTALKERFTLIAELTPKLPNPTGIIFTEYSYILREANMSYNISVGDVMALTRYLDNRIYDISDIMLLFVIRSIYSIKLYEYYDEYTEHYIDDPTKAEVIEHVESSHEIRKVERFHDISKYEKLVGGNFVNSNPAIVKILPQEGPVSRRNLRMINIKAIGQPDLLTDFNLSPADTIILREFFALTTSRRAYTRNTSINSRYRSPQQSQSPYYREKLTYAPSGIFDITSVFFNLLNIKRCYGRFSDTLYEEALLTKGSILRGLLAATLALKRSEGKIGELSGIALGKRMLSWFSIRNVEILDGLVDKLSVVDYRLGSSKKIIEIFFANIAKYEQDTYDRENVDGTGNPLKIRFDFASIIEKSLKRVVNDVAFNYFYNMAEFSARNVVADLRKNPEITSYTALEKIKKHYPVAREKYNEKIQGLWVEHKYSYEETVAKLQELEAFIERADGQPAGDD